MNRRFLHLAKYLVVFTALLFSNKLSAQPDYLFKNAVLVSGTDLTVGAVYRFSSVKTGLDALVTFTFKSPSCTLVKFDNDGGAGYTDAFQPEVNVTQGTNGYAEFRMLFVTAGTSTPVSQAKISATAIDIDGYPAFGGPLNEFDEISMAASSYADHSIGGGELTITFPVGWMRALNFNEVDYGSINTTATPVMASVVNRNVTFIDYRTGINNQSTGSTGARQKSLYFKSFSFPSSYAVANGEPLAINDLQLFKGTVKDKIELQWQLSNTQNKKTITLEKSYNSTSFTELKTYTLLGQNTSSAETFNYTDDMSKSSTKVYYRLKLLLTTGNIEYSHVLAFNTNTTDKTRAFDVYPTIIKSESSMSFLAEKDGNVQLQVLDNSGHIVMTKQFIVTRGRNTFLFTTDRNLKAGIYLLAASMDGTVITKRIVLQP